MTDRPSWKETGGVLLACAVLLVALVQADDAGSRREQAQAAVAYAAEPARPRPAGTPTGGSPVGAVRVPVTVTSGDVPGRALALSWLGLVALGGLAMAGAGARMISRRSA